MRALVYFLQTFQQLYPWLGHQPITADVIAFLKKHINGGPLQPITPIDTSDRKPQIVQIVYLKRGNDPQLWDYAQPWAYPQILSSEIKSKAQKYDFVLQTKETAPTWVYRTYGEIELVNTKGEVVAQPGLQWSISDGKKSLLFFNLTDQERTQLQALPDRSFSVRALHPEMLNVPKNLMFTL